MGKSIALQAGPGILSTSNYYLACGDDQRVIASTGFSDASDRSNRECRHAKHLPGLGKSIQEGHKFFFLFVFFSFESAWNCSFCFERIFAPKFVIC